METTRFVRYNKDLSTTKAGLCTSLYVSISTALQKGKGEGLPTRVPVTHEVAPLVLNHLDEGLETRHCIFALKNGGWSRLSVSANHGSHRLT